MSPLAVFVIALLFGLLAVTLRLARTASRAAQDLSWGLAPAQAVSTGWLSEFARRAGWRIGGSELGLAWAALVSICVAVSVVAGAGIAGVAAALALSLVAPLLVAWLSSRKTAADLEPQFGDAMALIAADVRSGSTVGNSISTVAQSCDEPLKGHFELVAKRVEGGSSLGAALNQMAHTTGSVDVRILATAVSVQESHGGSIAGLIDQIGETVADRQELRRLIVARSASMTMTVRIVTGAVALFVVVGATVLEQGRDFYSRPIGWLAVAVIAAMLVAANVVAAKLRDSVL